MKLSFVSVVSFSVIVSLTWLSIVSVASSLENDAQFADLMPIVTVDGKSYFVEKTAMMNWTAANSFCNANGMQLATIKTITQKKALDNAIWPDRMWFWTGGRDSRHPYQFVWDSDGETLAADFEEYFEYYYSILTCVCYWVDRNIFQSTTCDFSMRPLCESIHGK